MQKLRKLGKMRKNKGTCVKNEGKMRKIKEV
jgi:hypothetical protein